jgi:hypothetical protein
MKVMNMTGFAETLEDFRRWQSGCRGLQERGSMYSQCSMGKPRSDRGTCVATRALWRLASLLAITAWLGACATPVGVAPDMQGTYWDHALVTNPNGGGPQIERWGPPDPSFPTIR